MNTERKIFYIDPQSYYNFAVYDKSLLSNLDRNQSITFICSSLYDGGEIDGVNVLPIFRYNKKKGFLKVLSYIYTLIRIVELSINQKPTIIHVQWMKIPQIEYWVYRLIKKRTQSKIVYTAHNVLPHDSGNKYVGIFSKIYKLVDAIITHDNNSKNEIQKKFDIENSNIRVIPHGVLSFPVDNDKVDKEIVSIKSAYDLTNDKLLFTVIGNQNKYKGTDVLINVWTKCELLNKNPKCRLIIAGKWGDENYFVPDNISNITFEKGFISDERLVALLKVSDVLLLPYRKISQSGVLLSAIGYGTPFLVTEVGGLAEPLQYGDVGWKIKECEESLIMEILENMVTQPSQVKEKKLNDEDWEKVRKEYSWATIGCLTTDLYEQLINGK